MWRCAASTRARTALPTRHVAGKFLVLWRFEVSRPGPELQRAVLRQQDYGARLSTEGKLVARYHIVGGHGGAWIYEVESNEELDRLLAPAPVYNYCSFEVIPLAEMRDVTVIGEPGTERG